MAISNAPSSGEAAHDAVMAPLPSTEYTPKDSSFGAPYVDVDEWRERPRPHRYVHGGFADTHTLFSFYFPPAKDYQGRFFQYLEGGAGGHENLLPSDIPSPFGSGWVFDIVFEQLGAYLVESNQGHYPNEGLGFANDVELFGASSESARFARELAASIYGTAPHHGYVWGGSGGGSRSIYCLENAPDVYDGASPHVIWSGGAQPWSAWGYWWMHARDKRADIIDAVEAGGSGDPFATLTNDEREALATLYRRGWPRGAEHLLAPFWAWLFNIYRVKEDDPGYFEDFWTVPGYLGADDPDRLGRHLIDGTFTVRRTAGAVDAPLARESRMAVAGAIPEQNFGVILDAEVPDWSAFTMSKLTFLTGQATGREIYVGSVQGDVLMGFGEMAPLFFDGVEPGDQVHIDNREFVAWAHYHRYALDLPAYMEDPAAPQPVLAQEFGGVRADLADGRAIYPQRQVHREEPGSSHTGRFEGKMIHVNCTHDSMVWPVGIPAYGRKVRKHQGDHGDDVYRMWWVQNAPHGNPEEIGPRVTPDKDPKVWSTRMVNYDGVTAEALRSLVRWVEEGIVPPLSTGYQLTDDGGVILAATAKERGGVQPVVTALANGGLRADVNVGETVTFEGRAEQPPGSGTIVRAEWDFEGIGAWPHKCTEIDGSLPSITTTTTHVYSRPGTYFASFRCASHRDGSAGRGPTVQNLARVRVVVSA